MLPTESAQLCNPSLWSSPSSRSKEVVRVEKLPPRVLMHIPRWKKKPLLSARGQVEHKSYQLQRDIVKNTIKISIDICCSVKRFVYDFFSSFVMLQRKFIRLCYWKFRGRGSMVMLQGVSYRVLDARKKDDTSIFSILNGAPKEEIKVIRDKDTIKSSSKDGLGRKLDLISLRCASEAKIM